MDTIGWLILGIWLIGPIVGTAVGVCIAIPLIPWVAFKVNKKVGYATLCAVVVGTGSVAYWYVVRAAFNYSSACGRDSGIQIIRNVQANSYTLMRPGKANWNRAYGYPRDSDATIGAAITYVVNKRVQFVELQAPANGPYLNDYLGSMLEYRKPEFSDGYFKIFVTNRGSSKCRWLMPDDVPSLRYQQYLHESLSHELNKALQIAADGKECVAIDYVPLRLSDYSIEFSIAENVEGNLYKHEIRVKDRRANNTLVGKAVAYEYASDYIFASAAFRLGNGGQSSVCPEGGLTGSVLRKILNF
jgi:hypothetical protein